VVISQLYAAGGEPGAIYRNDFIELFNRGDVTIDLTGWSIQYASDTGTTWQRTNLNSATLLPGQHYLVQEASGGTNGSDFPTADALGGIPMSSTGGKVVLLTNNSLLTAGPCPFSLAEVDFVGYGASATCFEGSSPAPAPSATTTLRRSSDGCVDTDNNRADFALGAPNPRNREAALNQCTASIQFSSAAYSVGEASLQVTLNVTRSGSTSGEATVNYATSDSAGAQNCNVFNGNASSQCDYIASIGTLSFAPGESSKSISILIINDSYAEGAENFSVGLSSPTDANLGATATATVTINDNDTSTGANPIDQAGFFVTEHYYDFLNRQPDASGLAFWTNEITSCGADLQCIEVKRINVSAAYFLSIEFQHTGYLVERMYKSAYGSANGTSTFGGTHQLSVPIIRFNEFLPDTQRIGQGVIVGQSGWETVLENNKRAFASEFVQRSRFTSAYATALTPAQFVDQLFLKAGVTPSSTDRNAAIAEFGSATNTSDVAARARALRDVSENSILNQQEFNRAFVLMQFFGYLRRNPNDSPDSDYTGYDFWLTKLNQFNGNFVAAEMVKAFITSTEYRQRFGP